jgi:hypothetical protein
MALPTRLVLRALQAEPDASAAVLTAGVVIGG